MNNVLIIEDDKEICVMIKDHLEKYNYQVFFTLTGANAIERIKELSPDLIILDLMLPFISGDELIRNIRKFSDVPVIVVSAKSLTFNKVELLRLGADDYLTKPFDLDELLARIERNLLRSQKDTPNLCLTFGELSINTSSKIVTVADEIIVLTAKEYQLVELLAKYPDKVFSKQNLYESIWQEPFARDNDVINTHISDRRLEHLVEIINQIVSKDNIYLGEIQKKENELKENISCLSHDLRTPLTSIRGYLQLLSSAPDEKRAEYISALSGKALRLERLIDDFYQISLLEAGQYPFYYEKVELCSLLTEILLDNYSIFSVNGIEPQIEIPNMDIYLNADRKACIRIIQNLIFNAVTSTTNNVVIQLINIADSVQLCIKNPVASIPTEEYSKLLERFYVADVSRSNGTSGQGLYIVKKLLLMMNCTNPIIEIHDHNFMITIDFSPLLIKK